MSFLWQPGRILVSRQYGTTMRARRHRFSGRVEFWNDMWLERYGPTACSWQSSAFFAYYFRLNIGFNFRRRLAQWWSVIREEHELTGSWPNMFKMLAKLRLGEVERDQWRARMRICRKCKVFDGELKRCRGPQVGKTPPPGCGCYVPFLALTKTPYTSADGKRTGCWGRATIGPGFGWY